MTIKLHHATKLIEYTLRDEHPLIDTWEPAAKGPGSFFDSPNRPALRPPNLLGDDGNLLLAVVPVPNNGQELAGSWTRFANDAIRFLASLLHRATADYGMHRLLVIMLLPESKKALEEMLSEIATNRITGGQFRLVVLPHCDQPIELFKKDLADHLKLFSPFPSAPFLEPTAEFDLCAYIEEAFIGGIYAKNPFLQEVQEDMKSFLSAGAWDSGKHWPSTTRIIESRTASITNKRAE